MPKTSERPLPRIIVENVHKDFRLRHTHSMKETFVAALKRKPISTEFHALDGLDLTIDSGESVALLGFNGSGKSTLLKLMAGVITPDRGRVLTRGRVAGLIEVGAGFHPDLSGRENIYLNAAILGMSREETNARFDDIVAFSEIERFIDTEVKHYSSGMFLRLAFAVAIHTEVDVLLIDEILAVGDEPFQRKCLARIRELHAQGKTLVVVSHDLGMVSQLCARGVVLQGGKVAFDGPSSEAVRTLRALSGSPYVDVERSHPFFDDIVAMGDSGIVPPYPHDSGRGEVRLDEAVTFTSAATALHRLLTDSPLEEHRDVDLFPGDIAIDWLIQRTGLPTPVDPTSRPVSRAEFASILHALAGHPRPTGAAPFGDIDDSGRHVEAITWVFESGIARGWDEPDSLPNYRPDLPVAREALIIMLARFRNVVKV